MDVSEMVRQAREQHPAEPFPNLRFEAGDGVSLPAADGSRDFVFSYEVFQHMPSEDVIRSNLREVARVLRRDGAALLHVKTEAERGTASRLVPDALVRHKRALGRDPLVSDLVSRHGREPGSARACSTRRAVGSRAPEDPTHEPGTRVFVLASPSQLQVELHGLRRRLPDVVRADRPLARSASPRRGAPDRPAGARSPRRGPPDAPVERSRPHPLAPLGFRHLGRDDAPAARHRLEIARDILPSGTPGRRRPRPRASPGRRRARRRS